MSTSTPSGSTSTPSSTPSSAAAASMQRPVLACYPEWRPFLDAWPGKTIIRLIVLRAPTTAPTALHSEEGWARARTELLCRMRLLRDRWPYPGARRFGGAIFWADQVRFYTEVLESDYYTVPGGGGGGEEVNGLVNGDADADTRGLEMVDCGGGQGGPTPEAVRSVEGWLATVGDNDPQGGVWGLLVDTVVV
ncbi:hypothetical protein BO99DRAFT_433599 [Aspergillus violaceofuscus CBS 115571]|uniref:Uncharacterized protein n=1 Tax=Aspergillus violaceofuscus (strain CBS 115571) TaxID=1450538 RepID=A0A2V5H301_ASPV1|nr:hypothetical protein BO99DRAFT_433599 [Aspergillus violaceofuscus CBS 115571]